MHAKHPLDEAFERVKNMNFINNQATSGALAAGRSVWVVIGQMVGKVFGSEEPIAGDAMHSLHGFFKVAKGLVNKTAKAEEEVSSQEMLVAYETYRFASDVHFGEQILNGVNCVVVKKCNTLPDNFPVTNEMVQPFLNNGHSLKRAMQVIHCTCYKWFRKLLTHVIKYSLHLFLHEGLNAIYYHGTLLFRLIIVYY